MLQEIDDKLEKEQAKIKAAKLIGQTPNEEGLDVAKEYRKFNAQERAELFANCIFSIVWSVGSVIEYEHRFLFDAYFGKQYIKNELLTTFKDIPAESRIPDDQSIFDIYFDAAKKNWQPFSKHLGVGKLREGLKYHELFIPTINSVRNKYILNSMIVQESPFLIYGKTGTGKTQVIKNLILEELDESKYIPLITVLSANTLWNQLQDVLESKIEKQKRGRGTFGPLVGMKNIIFIDD